MAQKLFFSLIMLSFIYTVEFAMAQPVQKGAWVSSAQNIPEKAFASLPALHGTTSNGQPISLIVQCQQGKPLVGLNVGGYMKSGTRVPIEFKFDHEPVRRESWRVYHKTDTIYTDQPIQFLNKLITASTLTIRNHQINGGITSALFKLEGAEYVLSNINRQCTN